MKKKISLILCLLMLVSMLAACGKDKQTEETGEGGKIDMGSIFDIPGGNNQNTKPQTTKPNNTKPENTKPQTSLPVLDDGKAYTYEDITLTVPKDFQDITEQAGLGIYNFVVGNNNAAVCASRNDGAGYEYLAYAKLIAENTDNSGHVTDHGGYATFGYQASGYGMDFQYVVGIFPSGDQMWLVQAYCQLKDVDQWEATLEAIIHSIEIDSGKSGAEQPNSNIQANESNFSSHNVSMAVPEDYMDVTEQASLGIYDFVLSSVKEVVIMGTKIEGFSAEEYADLLDQSVEIIKAAQPRGNYIYQQYTAIAMGNEYIYDVGLFDDDDGVWIIQIGCIEKDHEKYISEILSILDSVGIE